MFAQVRYPSPVSLIEGGYTSRDEEWRPFLAFSELFLGNFGRFDNYARSFTGEFKGGSASMINFSCERLRRSVACWRSRPSGAGRGELFLAARACPFFGAGATGQQSGRALTYPPTLSRRAGGYAGWGRLSPSTRRWNHRPVVTSWAAIRRGVCARRWEVTRTRDTGHTAPGPATWPALARGTGRRGGQGTEREASAAGRASQVMLRTNRRSGHGRSWPGCSVDAWQSHWRPCLGHLG